MCFKLACYQFYYARKSFCSNQIAKFVVGLSKSNRSNVGMW